MKRWTYDYYDVPRPCYRIQDGSDDGDIAECWDEDVAQAICAAMNRDAGAMSERDARGKGRTR